MLAFGVYTVNAGCPFMEAQAAAGTKPGEMVHAHIYARPITHYM